MFHRISITSSTRYGGTSLIYISKCHSLPLFASFCNGKRNVSFHSGSTVIVVLAYIYFHRDLSHLQPLKLAFHHKGGGKTQWIEVVTLAERCSLRVSRRRSKLGYLKSWLSGKNTLASTIWSPVTPFTCQKREIFSIVLLLRHYRLVNKTALSTAFETASLQNYCLDHEMTEVPGSTSIWFACI